MVDGAETGPRHDQGRKPERCGEVQVKILFRQRDHDAPRPFHDHELMPAGERVPGAQDLVLFDLFSLKLGSHERRERVAKAVRVHVRERVMHVRGLHKAERVGGDQFPRAYAAARLRRLHHAYINPARSQR